MSISDFIYMPQTQSWYIKKTATYIYQSYMQSVDRELVKQYLTDCLREIPSDELLDALIGRKKGGTKK
jgi:hypothetical protein